MDRIWLRNYPPGVPAEIDPGRYSSLVELIEESFGKHRDADAYICMDKTLTYGQLDGLYVIRTSVAEADMGDGEAVLSYKRLAEVERAFRTLKGIDLQVRPIRHRLEARVKAHIFLSMLAYYVQWHMIEAWAPLTFKDEGVAEPSRLADPVAPARRSEAALAKVRTRTLADGTPALSFTRLLAHLATIVRNTMCPRSARPGEATFTLTTRPTPKQRQALDLIADITV